MNRREIKFKVWCNENEEFIQFNKMGFLEDGSLWYVQGVDENEEETDPPYFENQNDWELMQYTGLKDKNDIEIYEGDIIIDHLINGTKGEYFAVVKCYNYFYPKMIRNGKICNNIIDPMMFNQHAYRKGVEIIGNIYENPELLEREAE